MGNKKKQLSDEALLLAYRIREARVRKYKTAKEAAALFPVEKTLWGNWENARVRPQKATMEKLAAFLDVPMEDFSRKPENWDREKAEFLAYLAGRTRVRKEYYETFSASLPPARDDRQASSMVVEKPENTDPLAVFLQITRLIADAQGSVLDGKIPQETYDTHMRMIADMVKVSLFARK